jgi:biopolymer transport protein ExbB
MLKNHVFEALKQNDVKKAMEVCDRYGSPLTKVIKAGLLKFGCSKDEVMRAMEEAAPFEVATLEDRLSILSTVGQVAPLLGFLGTVCGMAVTFYTIHARSVAMNPVAPADVAGGLWQALLTTVAGLVVAVPTLIADHLQGPTIKE